MSSELVEAIVTFWLALCERVLWRKVNDYSLAGTAGGANS